MGKYDAVPLEREDDYGLFRLMAYAEGHVMVRRKGRQPVLMPLNEWVEIRKSGPTAVPLRPVS